MQKIPKIVGYTKHALTFGNTHTASLSIADLGGGDSAIFFVWGKKL